MKRILLLLAIFGLISCKHDLPIFQPDNLNNNHVSAFGHGGMGEKNLLPQDSKESILKVFDVNGEGTDIDIQMSSDLVLIAFHDEDMSHSTTGSGKIITHTAAEITCHKFKGVTLGPKHVRTVEDILNQVPYEKIISFDLKVVMGDVDPDEFYGHYTKAIYDMIDNHHPNSVIEVGDTCLARLIRAERPDLRIIFYPNGDVFENGYNFAVRNHCYGITIENNKVTASQIKDAHVMGIRVLVYGTENHKDNLDAYMKSPDFIETDNLKDLVDIVN